MFFFLTGTVELVQHDTEVISVLTYWEQNFEALHHPHYYG